MPALGFLEERWCGASQTNVVLKFVARSFTEQRNGTARSFPSPSVVTCSPSDCHRGVPVNHTAPVTKLLNKGKLL